ncbi:MAG: AI-2E family transporter [Actinomycetota bacterium]|nr:AI-2E family transporter [Actinomycetota bacterium]
MRASQIEARAVSKVVFVVLSCLALGAVLVYAVLHSTTTIRWVVTAIFLALALDPAVGLIQRAKVRSRGVPRWLAILLVYLFFFGGLTLLVLHVAPPLVKDVEGLAKKLPTYVTDFENWAENNKQFSELNDRYDITAKLSDQASSLPSTLSSGASELGSVTVSLLEHLIAFITVITLTFFLLLEGRGMFERGTGRLDRPHRDRFRRVGLRIAAVVRSYVSVNVLLALAAGAFTWGFLELQGFHLALPLALLVFFLDLIPLIGFTIAGAIVALVLGIDGAAGDVVVWLIIFLVYQQLQDRVIQPLMYRGGALKVNPAVAIVAILVGANLAGVLGALLAIPSAASLGVLIDEFVLSGSPSEAEPEAEDVG